MFSFSSWILFSIHKCFYDKNKTIVLSMKMTVVITTTVSFVVVVVC